ncbi:RraA family protein [Salipiger mangrovisoli]|uniref:Putative 4-hydroxy-4-methyl-2-oxoglutarate aldolase n=1 Tax=Salipiger mangrovisoli TaxID=2865933 RepID=A0ABR9XBC8_9RHOB|nr:RraA family protein [Salipiger mangrovisoli]MBE9640818.1 RraA family protein [Salipiger mangrovisoli]
MIRHPRRHTPALDPELLERLRALQPASLGHHLSEGFLSPKIRALVPGRMLGRAVTVRQPLPDAEPVHRVLDALRPGDVLVIDRCGDDRIACVGEMVALAARTAGAAGIVVDGVVTDIAEIAAMGLPLFARGTSVVTTRPLRVPGAELFGTICPGGVALQDGDLIFGDENGLLRLAPDRHDLAALVARAEADEAREVDWRQRLAGGESLAVLNGYDAETRP